MKITYAQATMIVVGSGMALALFTPWTLETRAIISGLLIAWFVISPPVDADKGRA